MRLVSKTPFVKGDKGDLVSEQNPQSLRASSFTKELIGTVFRPLAPLTKSDIYNYASEHSIEYREDITNTDTDYDRNRIRADIVPVLRDMHPTIHETIGELGEYMQELSWSRQMCEGPALVSELALDELLGEGRAVEPEHRPPAPPRRAVDPLGQHLLPHPGLAEQEHGDVRRRHPLDERVELPASPGRARPRRPLPTRWVPRPGRAPA